MPRSRPARATRARSVPGADGIAISISSGSASSRMRGSSSVAPSTFTPSIRTPQLQRVVVDEADGAEAELRVAHDLAQQQAAAVAGADDQHALGALARTEAAHRAVVDAAADEAHAADEREREQEEEREDAARDADAHLLPGEPAVRLDDRHEADHGERQHDDRLQDPDVVALGHVAPLLLLDPEGREDRERDHHDPREEGVAQIREAFRHPHGLVEAQPVREPPGACHEQPVQNELDQRVPVQRERRSKTSAHRSAV